MRSAAQKRISCELAVNTNQYNPFASARAVQQIASVSNAAATIDIPPVLDPFEKQARAYLAARRWRKARDDFKGLVKKDRAKFLPLLIEANVGLVQEMLGKGLVSEAQQVVAYLKTIASPEITRVLEVQTASKSGNTSDALPQVVTLLATNAVALSAADRIRWADQLVLSFAPPTLVTPTASPAEAQIGVEARAVQEALAAISAGEHDRGLDAVRVLARDSSFSHWRLFIKGLVAFHRGESEKAERAFAELPPASAPARASEPYRLLLCAAPLANRALTEPALETMARLTGHAGWGRMLLRSQAEWLQGRHIRAYQALREGARGFPSYGLDLPGVLSDFFFKAIFTLDENARDACEDYFLQIEEHQQQKNIAEVTLIRRTFCLLKQWELDSAMLKRKWEGFLSGLRELSGESRQRDSLGYGWLGEVLGQILPPRRFGFGNKRRVRSANAAMAALQKSIELDPANAAAYLKLCDVYEAVDRNSERNRLLDAMTARFPEHKEALLLAGVGCLDRKAYVKGIEYFERALQLDRLDPKIPDLIVSGSLRLARQHFEKGRLDLAQPALKRAGELLIEQPENFLRNPWCHLARRGVLEDLYGDAALGAELLQQARTASPFPAAFLLFVRIVQRLYTKGGKAPPTLQVDLDAVAKANANARHAGALVRLLVFWAGAPDAPPLQFEEDWVRRYLKNAAQQPFTRDEARQLVELLEPRHEFHKQANAFVKKVLAQDRRDPLFRLYEYWLDPQGFMSFNAPGRLQGILDEATRRGDEEAVKRARKALADLKAPPFPVEPDWEEPEDSDEDEDWDEPPDFAEGPDFGPGFPLPPLSPKDARMFQDLIDLLAQLPESELREARKTRPRDIPAEMFDMLVAMARGGKLPPLPEVPQIPKLPMRPPPQQSPAPKPQAVPHKDPNQMDLL